MAEDVDILNYNLAVQKNLDNDEAVSRHPRCWLHR